MTDRELGATTRGRQRATGSARWRKGEIEMTSGTQHHRRRPPSRHARRMSFASLEDVEREHVQRVLDQTTTFEEAADVLGINLATLWRMRKRWGLS